MLTKDEQYLSGAQKAAILLLQLGEEISATLFKELSEDEVRSISQEISNLGSVDGKLANNVIEDCHEQLVSGTHIHGNLDYVKKVIQSAFNPQEADDILRTVSLESASNTQGLAMLRQADPKQLSTLLQNEHPQTIALVISNLKGDHAAQTLALLPENLRFEVSMRMARMDQVQQSLRDHVLATVAAKVGVGEIYGRHPADSIRSVAEIFNLMDRTVSADCLDRIDNDDPTLALAIRDLMFVFDDILTISDDDMRKIMQRLDKAVLAKSLKGTQRELKEHFFRNMSERAKEMLEEDIETLGAIPLMEAERAKQEVIQALRLMESEGDLNLSRSAADQYVE